MGNHAFSGCIALKTVKINSGTTVIGNGAFNGCAAMTSVSIPGTVTSIGWDAFKNCEYLQSVTIPNSVKTIGSAAFINCKRMTSLSLGSGLTSIDYDVFKNCDSLTSITIPSEVESIGSAAFGDLDALSTLTINGKIKSMGNHAFSGCIALKTVTIASGTTVIGAYAFNGCKNLTSITIPESVKTIGYVNADKDNLVENDVFRNHTYTLHMYGVNNSFAHRYALANKDNNIVWHGGGSTVLPTGITLNWTKINSLGIGSSVSLVATVTPSNATDKTVTWVSSNSSVATVDSNGKVTGKSAGSVTITAKTSNNLTATCQVTVPADEIPINTLSLDKTNVTIHVGEYCYINADVSPVNATEAVSWVSGNTAVATVTAIGTSGRSGYVLGVSEGIVQIRAKTNNNLEAYCTVTVLPYVLPTSITLNKSSASMYVDDSQTLSVTFSPSNTTEKTISWSSSNTSVAAVTPDGTITAKAKGTTTITATTVNDKTATCTVTVSEKIQPTGVSLNKSSASLKVGESTTLTATVSPSNAYDKTVTWSTGNSSVATVSNGTVTAKSAGTATITAKTVNGKTATCTVTVSNVIQPTGITLSTNSISMLVGESKDIRCTVSPSTATDKSVSWSSSNTSVATVAYNSSVCTVKAKAVGSTTITARTSNGKTATCTVTVTAVIQPTGVSINKSSVSLKVGESTSLTATVSPSNATNKNVTWSSSNTSVATVNSSGIVAAVSKGKTTITVSTSNGKTASCAITVSEQEAESISLDLYNLNLNVGDKRYLSASIYPANTADKSVKWSSSNSRIARVDGEGCVTALRTGMVSITAKTANGIKAVCNVTIEKADKDTKPKAEKKNSDWYEKMVQDKVNDLNKLTSAVFILEFDNGETEEYTLSEIIENFDESNISDFSIDGTELGTHAASVILFGSVVDFDVEIVEHISGDINEDESVNMKDIVLLQQYLNEWDVNINQLASDVNGDGDINMKDIVLLQQYLNDWDVVLQ